MNVVVRWGLLATLTLGLFACSSASSGLPGAVTDGAATADAQSADGTDVAQDAEEPEDLGGPQDTNDQDTSPADGTGPASDTEVLEDSAALQDSDDEDATPADGGGPAQDVQTLEDTAGSPDIGAPDTAPADDTGPAQDAEALEDTEATQDADSMSSPGDASPEEQDVDSPNLCDLVAPSNEGCLFTAVTTANPDLGDLFVDDFAVVLANRSGNPTAAVTITQGDSVVAQGEVPPGETTTFSLSMVSALVDEDIISVLAPEAAYEIATDVPVTATQFSPLQFQVDDDFTMSNDASLLLPHHALTQSYTAVGFPSWAYWVAWRTGFLAIAATADDTTVTVTASAPIASGGLLPEMAPGDTQTVTLHRGDVLQLLGWAPPAGIEDQITAESCDGPGWQFAEGGLGNACEGADLDLTGTTVTSSAPVAVFTGHSCLRVPFDAHACDHVEEQLLPDAAWGQEVVLSAPQRPDAVAPGLATYRVVAQSDDTTVTLSPSVAGPFTLSAGEAATFTTNEDVRVNATGPILAVMALHSAQGLEPPAVEDNLPLSDPSIGLLVPLRQARDEYVFLTPDTFQSDWVNVVAFQGSEVLLDGAPVTGWTAVANTPYAVARVPVAPGNHHIVSPDGQSFTLMSYGHANHTSYLYPGGLNLDP